MASVNRDILCSKEKKWPAQNRNSRRHTRVNKGLNAEPKENVSYTRNSKRWHPYIKICGKNCNDCFIKKARRISEENGGGKLLNVSHSTKDVVLLNNSSAKTIPSKLVTKTTIEMTSKEVPKPKKTRRNTKITISEATDEVIEKIDDDESPNTRLRVSSRIQKRSVRSNVQIPKVENLMATDIFQGKKL